MSSVRVRFAPSPTGFFHIGSARTALFNWLYARHTGGKFILRIEDTDKERNSDAFLKVILDSMHWLGTDWDEGPVVGGEHGPYFQSQRTELYHAKLKELADKGRAYEKDGAWWLRLEGARSTVFDDHLKKEIEKVDAAPMVLDDLVRGRVERAEDRDFVIFRSNGEPVFHFVNVVDDIAMKITHVIRGEDHLSNTSKHLELFKAFGVEPPKYAHIPLILKTDGPGKMSKRDRGALIEEYQQRRYLPEAVRNYLCLLGWTPTDGREVLPIADIIAQFEVGAVHQSNARFDERKMANVNMQTLRALTPAQFAALARPVLADAGVIDAQVTDARLEEVLAVVQEKAVSLEHLPDFVRFFFTDDFKKDENALANLTKKGGDPQARVAEILPALAGCVWTEAAMDAAFATVGAAHGRKPTDYFAPVRFAVSGQGGGAHLQAVLRVLGQETVLKRLKG
ncbi:glutamate--tRNA ligase [Verrucomicrobiota bacterium]|nr:glutamate--tRNA ligase [Verrucomicrobiota bacterium]GDY18080.1 glutamate--tRNA ligase [Verrucomicrobiota bacterium]